MQNNDEVTFKNKRNRRLNIEPAIYKNLKNFILISFMNETMKLVNIKYNQYTFYSQLDSLDSRLNRNTLMEKQIK